MKKVFTGLCSLLMAVLLMATQAACLTVKVQDGGSSEVKSSASGKEIVPDDTAEERIREYVDKADQYADQGKYEEAKAALDTAEQLYGKSALITNKKAEINKRKAIADIKEYIDQQNYERAIRYIASLPDGLKNDGDIIERKNLCISRFRETALANAESLFRSVGYAAAIEYLNSALSVLPNDESISKKISEYEEYAPVSVKKLKSTAGKSYSYPANAKDPRGNSYSDSLLLESYRPDLSMTYNGEVEYYVGKAYNRFECRIVPEKDYSTRSTAEGYVRIYADEKLIYTSEKVTYKTSGIDVSVSISNAEYLKICLYNPTASGLMMENAPILLVNPAVYK